MPRRIRLHCPSCNVWLERNPEAPLEPHWSCKRCETGIIRHGEGAHGDDLPHCVVCDCTFFYVEKDFPKALRFTFMGIAIGLSFFTYGISLFVAAAVDWLLYQNLPFVRICYLCNSEYRGFKHDPSIKSFDPHKGVAYDARRAVPETP